MRRPSVICAGTAAACLIWLVARAVVGIDVSALPHGRGTVQFTDRTGVPLGSIVASNEADTAWVPLDRVAPVFRRAILAAEDARFYRHGAVDVAALARAGYEYVVDGEARSGGSTIAMQLARSIRYSPSTLRGKLAQIVEAERIVLRSPQNAVLQAYINRVPMGGDLYGVEAASHAYFGVSAANLDLAQAALLAAIPNDPPRLSPYDHWAALRERQRYVLARMAADGAISPAQAALAQRERIEVLPPRAGPRVAQHFLFALYPHVTSGNEQVRTTLDASLQRFVQAQVQAITDALIARHVTDAAALVIDNRTGDVLAYVGSPDYYSDALLGRNDGVQSLRQPGSSLKPFTYELALERGSIESTTILADAPAAYAIPGGKLYQPADYSTRFAGPVRVRYALANSLNVPAVRVLSRVGVDTLLDRLHALGFTHLDKPGSFYGLGLTLGSGEVTLWELAHAYLTMARAGAAIPLRATLDAPRGLPVQIGNSATWQLVTDMLADPHARAQSFGVDSILRLPFPAAVKTGTSSDYRDTWTVGFTRDYTVGVWVGNFDGSAMRGISGVTGAGPLWNHIMLHLYETHDAPPFASPPGYVHVPICATTGLRPDASCEAAVMEWVLPQQLAAWRRPMRYRSASVRILFPHDGDVFVLNPAPDALARSMQRLELRAVGAGRIRWSAGRTPLRVDAEGHAFWLLRLGRWTISATNGKERALISIRVIRSPRGGYEGFSPVGRR
ncbi:MAG TPA: penicillin-binding protein 1C [Candidatus Tyrphobacter sp.]